MTLKPKPEWLETTFTERMVPKPLISTGRETGEGAALRGVSKESYYLGLG
jgi:hypothetical protein